MPSNYINYQIIASHNEI